MRVAAALATLALAAGLIGATSAAWTDTETAASSLTAATDFRPLNTVAPAISGTVLLTSTLSSTAGTWGNTNTAPTLSYQWQYCPGGISCVNIPGETAATYQITAASLLSILGVIVVLPGDAQFQLVETATNSYGSHTATSNLLS